MLRVADDDMNYAFPTQVLNMSKSRGRQTASPAKVDNLLLLSVEPLVVSVELAVPL